MIDRVCSLIKMKVPERNRGILWASKSRVPSNVTDADGYQGGCIWINTEGAAGTGVWTNEGSVTAASWVAFDTSAGAGAGTVAFDDATTGPLISIETTDQEGDAYLNPFLITGTYASSCKKGIMLSATNTRPVTFLFDNHSVALGAADYRAVLSRVYICSDQGNAFTLNAMRAQIKLADLVDFTNAANVLAPFTGYLELAGTGARTLNGHVACVRAALEEGAAGTTTIGTYLAGFEATLNSTRTYAGSGLLAGLLVNISGGASLWQYGVEIEDGACGIGLHIGNCTTEGILIDGTASSAQIKVAGTAILASGEQAIYVNCAAETVATNGMWVTLKSTVTSGDCSGLRSKVTSLSAGTGCNPRGVYSQALVGASKHAGVVDGILATADVAAGGANVDHLCAVRGHISSGATFTSNTSLYAGHFRVQSRGDETISGTDDVVLLENEAHGGTGRQMNSYLRMEAGGTFTGGIVSAAYLIDAGTAVDLLATAVLRLPDDGTVCEASAAGTGDAGGADFVGFIKVIIGTTTMYIPLLTGTPAAIFT